MLSKYHASEPALHINEIDVNDKYEFIKIIGKGSYGEVFLVLPKKISSQKSHRRHHVLKRLDLRQTLSCPSENAIEGAEREANLLSTLKHPNIVAYTESFRSKDGFLNIVMAYCEGGDLYTKLKEKKKKKELLTEDQIIEWFIQICMALQYIHEKNILHRDLKTQNIFLTKNEIVKVGDLGIARVLESGNDLATTVIGTPFYMSPEIFLNKPYGQKSDIWSLGCCIYEMTTLEHVFSAKDMTALKMKIIREQTPQISKVYSEQLRQIVKSMLKKDADDRPTAKNILQNAFIKQHILRLLEKAQAKCQNHKNSKSQPVVTVSPVSSPSRSSNPPHSSASRPISASNPSSFRNRLSNNNHQSTPILPSFPILPSSHSRPSSGIENNRSESIQSNEQILSDSRIRRRSQARRSNPILQDNDEKDFQFLSKVSHNDTLQRFRRKQQHSSSDEQDIPSNSPQHEENLNAVQSPQHSEVSKSFDLNSSARRRRRETKLHSSTDYSTPNQTVVPESNLKENLLEEIENKKEGDKDMNDFVFQLTSTLQLPAMNIYNSNEHERTFATSLHETTRLHQLCEEHRENCLREISPNKLRRVLKILENVSEAEMKQEMIDELGEDLFNKYSGYIYSLKFYEDNLSSRS